jgi:GTP-binding protein EngB required for normal cell division
LLVVSNKADKIKKSELDEKLAKISERLELKTGSHPIPFSAQKGTGRMNWSAGIAEFAQG